MKQTGRQFGRIFISGFLVLQIILGYSGALGINTANAQILQGPLNTNTDPNASTAINVPEYTGVEESIKQFLCVPDDNNLGTALVDCITKVYRFGIAFGAIALVFFIVFAGYLYMAGGEASKDKGKTIFTTALTGMVIILSSYVLLRFINPELTIIKPIQAPIFTAGDFPKCEDVGFEGTCVLSSGQVQSGGGNYGGKKCTPITNNSSPASVDNLSKSCFGKFGADVVKQASIVASAESGGNPALHVHADSCGKKYPPGRARCVGGEYPVWGLYQINLTVHPVAGLDCPKAFSGEWVCSRQCKVINPDLYNKCAAAAKDPKNNIDAACVISQKSLSAGKPRFNAWGNDRDGNEHGKRCGF